MHLHHKIIHPLKKYNIIYKIGKSDQKKINVATKKDKN